MHNYRDQLEIIKAIRISEGEHKTLDCPFCGGRKKFTLDRLATGELLWNCFRASCNAKGRYNGDKSITGAKAYLAQRAEPQRMAPGLPIPAFTTRIEHHDEVCEYLRSVNSYEAYENGLIRIRYAPREKRVLFYNQDNNGAVGRAMYHLGGKGPKWMTYGDISHGIAVGTGQTAVIVEDVASACSIASLGNIVGFALLGTNITNTLKNTLRNYLYKYILLDNDAQNKAVSMQKRLRGNTFIRTTNKDPKELTKEQLLNTLRITTTNKPHQPST